MPSERGSTIAQLYMQLMCVCVPVCVSVLCVGKMRNMWNPYAAAIATVTESRS